MATQSFLKSVNVRTKKKCGMLVRALEKSQSSSKKPAKLQKEVRTFDKKQLREVFGSEE